MYPHRWHVFNHTWMKAHLLPELRSVSFSCRRQIIWHTNRTGPPPGPMPFRQMANISRTRALIFNETRQVFPRFSLSLSLSKNWHRLKMKTKFSLFHPSISFHFTRRLDDEVSSEDNSAEGHVEDRRRENEILPIVTGKFLNLAGRDRPSITPIINCLTIFLGSI